MAQVQFNFWAMFLAFPYMQMNMLKTGKSDRQPQLGVNNKAPGQGCALFYKQKIGSI